MRYTYKTVGTDSEEIRFDINGNVITNVQFIKGCPGNTIGVAKLVEGKTVEDIEKTLKGIRCPFASGPTSCPDQLAIAARKAYEETSRPRENE